MVITDYAMSYDSGDNFYRKTIAIILILHPYDNGTLYDCHTEYCLHVSTVVRKKVFYRNERITLTNKLSALAAQEL